MMALGILERTIPGKPRSRMQRCKTTEAGLAALSVGVARAAGGHRVIPKDCKRLAEVDFPIAEVSRHAAPALRVERRMEIRSMNRKSGEGCPGATICFPTNAPLQVMWVAMRDCLPVQVLGRR